MSEFELEEKTYKKLSRLVIDYLGREPESETIRTKVVLIFGLNEQSTLILKTIGELSYISKFEHANKSKHKLIKLKGNVIRFIYNKKERLNTGGPGDKIHISMDDKIAPKTHIDFPKVSIKEFESLTVQTLILSCIERDNDEYKAQFNTLNRLIDIYQENEAIYWTIWLFLTGVFSCSGGYVPPLDREVAEEMLINGIPVVLSMRLRLIKRLSDEILDKLDEYSLLDEKLRPKYSNTFEQIFIPRGDYIKVINFLTGEIFGVYWDQLVYFLNRGTLYPLVVSSNLGEVL